MSVRGSLARLVPIGFDFTQKMWNLTEFFWFVRREFQIVTFWLWRGLSLTAYCLVRVTIFDILTLNFMNLLSGEQKFVNKKPLMEIFNKLPIPNISLKKTSKPTNLSQKNLFIPCELQQLQMTFNKTFKQSFLSLKFR